MAALPLPAPFAQTARFHPVERAARRPSAANHARFRPDVRAPPTQTPVGKFKTSPRTCPCPRRSAPEAPRRATCRARPFAHRGSCRLGQSPGGGRAATTARHSPQCRRIFSITSPCGGSIKATTFICPPHCGQASGSISYTRLMSIAQVWLARRRRRSRCGSARLDAVRGGFRRLAPHAAGLVRVPAVIADQVRALGRNVLRELGQEIQRREDLEIPLRPGRQPVALRIGKGPAGVLLGLVDRPARSRSP